jgi:protein tyrosine phosphatase (PTP) superfamily phosphohydrolase (DUF442 family)
MQGTRTTANLTRLTIAAVKLALLLGVVFPIICWIAHDRYLNFHIVIPNQVYRSGQMSAWELTSRIHTYQIRSVLNLRGENHGVDWYEAESDVIERENLCQYDLALSRLQEPTPCDVQELIHIYSMAPRPILIHCQSGADRTSMAVVVWLLLEGESPDIARRQMGWYFHQSPYGSSSNRLDLMLNTYEKWMSENELLGPEAPFRQWVRTEYNYTGPTRYVCRPGEHQ